MTRRELLAQAAIPYLDKRGADVHPGSAGAADIALPYLPVGFFGPADAAHSAGGAIYMGVRLALEEAEGKSAKPFKLFSRWADDPWRAGASAVVKLAYEDSVLAVIGGIDSATTHLAGQVAAKALFPLLDPVTGDETANGAGVPWMFSFGPGDTLYARALAAALEGKPYTLLAATDHGSRQLARALTRVAQPAERHDFAPPGLPPAPVHEVVVVLAPARSSAEVAGALPGGARIFAGPQAHSRLFRQLARRIVTAPGPAPLNAELAERLRTRFSHSGDAFTQLAYDSTAMLIRSILEAGPNRATLRERLAPHFQPNGRRMISSVLLQEVSPS